MEKKETKENYLAAAADYHEIVRKLGADYHEKVRSRGVDYRGVTPCVFR